MSSDLATAMRETSNDFLAAFATWKTDPIMALRAPECIHDMLPASLKRSSKNNEQFRAYFTGVERAMNDVTMEMHDYFASVEDRRAWFHTTLTATAVDGEPYDNEYMFVLTFDEEGRKVTRVLEMLDSVKTQAIYARLAKAREKGLL
nr:hypothetical protein B0A51_07714 [Rachicladosporium sp. CCFEE 5018]